MTSEQLLATRATLWRQKAEPLLTLDDAQSWLLQSGLCLFLPRKAQIPAPAPSFVEACLGETNATPTRAAIGNAKSLLVRLIEAGSALPLNLLGTPTDHPDFLVSAEALPFVYALRGDRDWKHAPGTVGANRVSPLVTHVWKLLEKRGVLTATEIQEELGKELTEAAVLRALHELWASLRVVPLYQAGEQETLWEPLQSRHQKAMASGVGMSQVTALSVLLSVYLQSVVAASGEDAESFLSPLASRSKVREVVRGLTATRQLALIQMETQSLLYVEGSLPEFPEAEKPLASAAEPVRRAHPTSPAGMEAALKRKVAGSSTPRPAYKRPVEGAAEAPPRPSGTGERSFRPAASRGAEGRPDSRKREGSGYRPAVGGVRRAAASGDRPFKPRAMERSEPGTGLRADGSPKKPRWRDMPGGRPDQKGKPARFGPRKAETTEGDDSPRQAPRREAGTLRPAAGGSKPPFKRSSVKRSSGTGEGRPFRPATSGRTFGASRPTGAGRPSGSFRPAAGPPRSSSPRSGAPRSGAPRSGPPRSGPPRSDRPSYGGSRPPTRPFNTGRPPIRSTDSRPTSGSPGSRPPARSGAGRFVARPSGGRPFPGSRREDGERPATPRDGAPGGDRKFTPKPPRAGGFSSARPRTGDSKPYSSRSGGGSARPPSGRPPSAGRPSTGRPASGRAGGGPGYKSSGPRSGAGPRPGFGQGPRPGAGRPRPGAGAKPGGRPPAKFKKRPE